MFEPSEDVVTFIADYMNEAHGEAVREIAAGHGFHADVVEIAGMSSAGMTVRGRTGEGDWVTAIIAWPAPLQRREDIRRHLQQMQDDARFSQY